MQRSAAAVLGLTLLVGQPAATHAESFVIDGPFSYLIFDYEGDFFRFAGDGSVIADSGAFGIHVPRLMVSTCNVCEPGGVFDPGFRTPGAPGAEVSIGGGDGGALIGGVSYSGLSYTGWFEVDAVPIVFPSTPETFVRASTPFSFSGFLRAFSGGTEVFTVDLAGRGTAFAPFVIRPDGRYEWEEGRLDYIFAADSAPVPEPMSLLLVGSGLAGLVMHRRRRAWDR